MISPVTKRATTSTDGLVAPERAARLAPARAPQKGALRRSRPGWSLRSGPRGSRPLARPGRARFAARVRAGCSERPAPRRRGRPLRSGFATHRACIARGGRRASPDSAAALRFLRRAVRAKRRGAPQRSRAAKRHGSLRFTSAQGAPGLPPVRGEKQQRARKRAICSPPASARVPLAWPSPARPPARRSEAAVFGARFARERYSLRRAGRSAGRPSPCRFLGWCPWGGRPAPVAPGRARPCSPERSGWSRAEWCARGALRARGSLCAYRARRPCPSAFARASACARRRSAGRSAPGRSRRARRAPVPPGAPPRAAPRGAVPPLLGLRWVRPLPFYPRRPGLRVGRALPALLPVASRVGPPLSVSWAPHPAASSPLAALALARAPFGAARCARAAHRAALTTPRLLWPSGPCRPAPVSMSPTCTRALRGRGGGGESPPRAPSGRARSRTTRAPGRTAGAPNAPAARPCARLSPPRRTAAASRPPAAQCAQGARTKGVYRMEHTGWPPDTRSGPVFFPLP